MCTYVRLCMHVCMYACIHACRYVCMYKCMYVCIHVCMYTCMYVCTHVCMYACRHECVYVFMCALESHFYVYSHINPSYTPPHTYTIYIYIHTSLLYTPLPLFFFVCKSLAIRLYYCDIALCIVNVEVWKSNMTM
jgi:hypothetical protein